ncbi:hypothetical protein Sjap_006939 [Stephania japonica]|uniref:Uncharacterized protein n=1 Tax=Stephania japonica TaxID=461633 RepID=A0AAP0K6V9_9MAGN
MALRKFLPSSDAPSFNMTTLKLSSKVHEKAQLTESETGAGPPFVEADADVDMSEVYFLIMHFLSAGPCHRTYGQLWNELLEHQLLPRRYHAWYSRSGSRIGVPTEDESDDGCIHHFNICRYSRYPHIEKDHLVKLLKQLILTSAPPLHGMLGGNAPNAADVPTLLGSGSFSLLESDRSREDKVVARPPSYLRWPHMQADQVRGLGLREIGGGFTKHHRAPSIRAACYAIAKPSSMVNKMQNIKKIRGHRDAVYCAIFDRSGRYVITGSDDRLVKIWSMETAFCLASCRGHEGDITDLAVSSNNSVVASASNDFTIRVWRLPDGLPVSVLRGHTGAVTAIVFSPRPAAVYHLLSSSDDGTCRIWDARTSQSSPRIYHPKPPDVLVGKSNGPPSSNGPPNHQILCCAYNANGTVFVTGSSDTLARVWNACKFGPEDSEQPIHEMDVLSGHENDVNYVQFSGCAVGSRSSITDPAKEENVPKFKNSWFTHDNIVTCSRDGSAIIWIPRSRRSHGKVGRWTRAYHLKVPPPPMPPQPARGGPRQRYLPTPRGVNMIIWSLDNRFVLAAIMVTAQSCFRSLSFYGGPENDCRICVWNAVDGSLVHSLTGHTESTYVLDVHPFNPRIAMSAGYDGRTIVWDIWEGTPIRIYEIGRFKLVDGKFSTDGTSIVLSDEVGQIFILSTGQGEAQKDAKYDQFFLGDYRPIMQDTHGNALDQAVFSHKKDPYLDILGMTPYPEPYQSMYQRRRLGALGIEWRPSSAKLAVGPVDINGFADYQMLPLPDLDRIIEPMPEFLDAMDWEPADIEVQSDDNDSEYNVTDEYSSEGEQGSLSYGSFGDPECSAHDSEVEDSHRDTKRKSKRKKHRSDVEIMTSSGRRVKRRNLDDRDGTSAQCSRPRKSRNGQKALRKKLSKSKTLRPQRLAARNALHLFSRINGAADDEEDESSETDSSESDSDLLESRIHNSESDRYLQNAQHRNPREREALNNETNDIVKTDEHPESSTNPAGRRRLVLKLPVRDLKKYASLGNTKSEITQQVDLASSSDVPPEVTDGPRNHMNSKDTGSSSGHVTGSMPSQSSDEIKIEGMQSDKFNDHLDLSAGYKDDKIKWGEVKARSSKRMRSGDSFVVDSQSGTIVNLDNQVGGNNFNGHLIAEREKRTADALSETDNLGEENVSLDGLDGAGNKRLSPGGSGQNSLLAQSPQDDQRAKQVSQITCDDKGKDPSSTGEHKNYDNAMPVERTYVAANDMPSSARTPKESASPNIDVDDCKSSRCDLESQSPKNMEENSNSVMPTLDEWPSRHEMNHDNSDGPRNSVIRVDKNSTVSSLDNSKKLHLDGNSKMYNSVYRRSKSLRTRTNSEGDSGGFEESSSKTKESNSDPTEEFAEATGDPIHRTRSQDPKAMEKNFNITEVDEYDGPSTRAKKFVTCTGRQIFSRQERSNSRSTVGLRSTRIRRVNHNGSGKMLGSRSDNSMKKLSWLMLSEHEESYRYIPQLGDEVAYLIQASAISLFGSLFNDFLCITSRDPMGLVYLHRKIMMKFYLFYWFQGHQEYAAACSRSSEGPWRTLKGSLRAVEFCKVDELHYASVPSGESCCKMMLEFVDPSSNVVGKKFKLTYPELLEFPDFLVEKTRYEAALERNWTTRDKCLVWWRDDNAEGGNWWEGRIMSVKAKSPEFPDSPWEKFSIRYKTEGETNHSHSPWELHDPGIPWEHPRIDEEKQTKLLSVFAKLIQTGNKNQDRYGIQRLHQLSEKKDFLNRFPVPLTLDLTYSRLENNYYRSLEAIEHDIKVMLENAQSEILAAEGGGFGRRMGKADSACFVEL